MVNMNYDLDRLAAPTESTLRRGRGITTSDIVNMISMQEFHGEDIIIYSSSIRDIEFHSKMVVENARKMGFAASQIRFNEVKIDRRKVSYKFINLMDNLRILPVSHKEASNFFYYLSPITHEFCDRKFFITFQ